MCEEAQLHSQIVMPGLSPAESLNAPVPRATISAARPCRLALRTLPIILRQKDNVVLNSLHVRVTTGTAISCFNSTNVRLKNLKIEHAAEQGSGIYFDRCHGLHIEDVSIASIGASRPNARCRKPYSDCDSIKRCGIKRRIDKTGSTAGRLDRHRAARHAASALDRYRRAQHAWPISTRAVRPVQPE